MTDPATITTLTSAIENSTKVANTPLFSTVIDKMLGFKISEWKAQGDVIKKQIQDGYEEARQKGLGVQYVSVFRSNANLINIGVKAANYIDNSKENDISLDNDFFWGLLEHAKEISEENMQDFISKIMAGEYNQPGSYSMSTLQVIKSVGKVELELFERVGSLLIDGDRIPNDLFTGEDASKGVMSEIGLDFGKFQILQGLGLILPNDMSQTLDNQEQKDFKIDYFDKKIIFEADKNIEGSKILKVPNFYGLSIPGKQIMNSLKPNFSQLYYEWLTENYKVRNYSIKN